MVASTYLVGMPWVLLSLIGGVGGTPLGGAPLELDPTLAAIAPEECLWYASFSGQGVADPNSPNQTEQLFAEPQVQRFFEEIKTQAMRAIRRAGGPQREHRVLAAEVPKLVEALMLRPWAAYVEDVRFGDNETVDVEAAFVLNTGDRRIEVESAIAALMKLAQEKGLLGEGSIDPSVQWHRLKTPPKAPEAWVGWQDEYLILAVGKATSAKLLKRMEGSAPAWLTELRKEHPVKRELTTGYVNVAGILERVKPIVQHKHPEGWPNIERLGLTSIQSLHSINGYDEFGVASTAHVVTNGERRGLLSLAPYKPLDVSDLEVIPQDALVALAARNDPSEFWDNLVSLVAQFDPRAQDKLDKGLWEVETKLGVNVRDDVVGALGDVWIAYLPSGDLFTSWFNSAAAVRVKDPARLREAVNKMVEVAKGNMARHSERATIVETSIETANGRETASTVQFEKPLPFAPSWCISDKWLVVGLQPQAIASFLNRKAEDSLTQSKAVRAAVVDSGKMPAVLIYQDTPQLVRSTYPWVQIGAQVLSGQLRRQGIDINAGALPSLETIVRHLRPRVAVMSHAENGFHFESIGSLPSGGSSVGAAPILAGLLLPAVQKARDAARTAQEINNLKQLSLAALNYESSHRTYPTDIYSADGKPLLSWRVQLVPYLESSAARLDFHKDEPWDSEHNRQFLSQMPDVFKSHGDGRPDMTRYLALKGEETLFRGKEGMPIRRVTDGTSNTLLFVQAAPGRAVEWTRPADIEYDADAPFAGLESPQDMFLAALCDGSVQRISLAISKATMKALATPDGDEPVDRSALAQPPGPHDYNADRAAEGAVK